MMKARSCAQKKPEYELKPVVDNYFFVFVLVEDPRILDLPGFFPACLGIFKLFLDFEVGGVKL